MPSPDEIPPASGYRGARRRPRWSLLLAVGLFHLLVLYGLVRALAPDLVAPAENAALSAVRIVVTPEPEVEPSPDPNPEPNEGAAGKEAANSTPREIAAPDPPLPLATPSPVPRASSTGELNQAGAGESGNGTGAGGDGFGTGSGRSGSGRGGAPVTRPVHIAGDITGADIDSFPIPPGGREVRFGQHVDVYMTVDIDGRARDCRVVKPSNDPIADRIVCQLAEDRFRFRPATNANGDPVPATYGWRQRFFER